MRKKYKILIGVACALLILAGASAWFYWLNADTSPQQKGSVAVAKEALHVFFPLNKIKLGRRVIEIRSDTPDRERADLILKELKKAKSINPGVQLREVATGIDGVLYLNLSKNLTETLPGAPPEIIMVYALVNSFATSFKDVRKVQLLVEGEPVYTIGGLLYTYLPLEFNKDLMED
jgi:hypothetical protein